MAGWVLQHLALHGWSSVKSVGFDSHLCIIIDVKTYLMPLDILTEGI